MEDMFFPKAAREEKKASLSKQQRNSVVFKTIFHPEISFSISITS